jgi:hypothetical protein
MSNSTGSLPDDLATSKAMLRPGATGPSGSPIIKQMQRHRFSRRAETQPSCLDGPQVNSSSAASSIV